MIGMTLLKNIERDTSPLNRLPQEKVADEIWNFMLYGLMKPRSKNAKQRRANDRHGDQY